MKYWLTNGAVNAISRSVLSKPELIASIHIKLLNLPAIHIVATHCPSRPNFLKNLLQKTSYFLKFWRLEPTSGSRGLGSPPPMSSLHRNLEPLGRWHATIFYLFININFSIANIKICTLQQHGKGNNKLYINSILVGLIFPGTFWPEYMSCRTIQCIPLLKLYRLFHINPIHVRYEEADSQLDGQILIFWIQLQGVHFGTCMIFLNLSQYKLLQTNLPNVTGSNINWIGTDFENYPLFLLSKTTRLDGYQTSFEGLIQLFTRLGFTLAVKLLGFFHINPIRVSSFTLVVAVNREYDIYFGNCDGLCGL